MSENIDQPIRRSHVTDLVVDSLNSYDQLNPPIQISGDSSKERNDAFRYQLESTVNQSKIIRYTSGNSFNSAIFQLADKQENPIPILLKVINPDKQNQVDDMEKAHQLHVDLLGAEFVEDMTRVTVTNEAILNHFRTETSQSQMSSIEAFAQDLRGLDKKQSLFQYLLEHRGSDTSPKLRGNIKLFLERLVDGYGKGYSFDIGIFPDGQTIFSSVEGNEKFANILVDDEGVTFIDSGLLRKFSEDKLWHYGFYDIKLACQLFTGDLKPEDIPVLSERAKKSDAAEKIKDNIAEEVSKLKASLENMD
ncbi:hypothetical protein COU87_03875 [Candidatus Roizmanbacteria bacterium CG10_big_fil_rev_8_21_14_0_10_39_12]|uniref:Uncharacterized protein n=1 Tax=Candidatus Roizmanbacteria bacterium CG10_big_fil_rev_8_21_14_0_10_39_12 TaxID=1974852 RepID=A0A2M8KNR9_9BACT|nr:MAG: hypothetical protein COY15_01945 [Candidatus Roizmanbacteria bacterium CG_4_10_14_0_2_um_filter_39_12]PJE61567.1 MAG: hypothetical protein COU87_03875 [Candidatus Roizmanbacteria bacterium CG10_big_fil_rev_8_21_14_0_10_39_12]